MELLVLLTLVLGVAQATSLPPVGGVCSGGAASLCLPEDYSKFELPRKDAQNRVAMSLDIEEVREVNDRDYSITFGTYFNVEWRDERINLSPDFGADKEAGGEPAYVPVEVDFVKNLWLPNVFIYNLRRFTVMEVLSPLSGLWISTDKDILFSQATTITFQCPMNFDMFPFDTQTCTFRTGSYSYDDSKLLFLTKTTGYASKTDQHMALDYAITGIWPLPDDESSINYGNLGNFSVAGFKMELKRHFSSHLTTYYLPSALCVLLSWAAFLLPDQPTGPLTLLGLLLLTLVTLATSAASITPKAGGLTALDLWMLASLLQVFSAFLGCAAALLRRKGSMSISSERWNGLALIIFPAFFLVFNIIYWYWVSIGFV